MIEQVSVFLENDNGRLADLTKSLGDAGISMHNLMIAETGDYGVIRIVTDMPDYALEVLQRDGYNARLTSLFGIRIADRPGSLAELLGAFESAGVGIEYAYGFCTADGRAVCILRFDNNELAQSVAESNNLELLTTAELFV
jgi:hypothetical protein